LVKGTEDGGGEGGKTYLEVDEAGDEAEEEGLEKAGEEEGGVSEGEGDLSGKEEEEGGGEGSGGGERVHFVLGPLGGGRGRGRGRGREGGEEGVSVGGGEEDGYEFTGCSWWLLLLLLVVLLVVVLPPPFPPSLPSPSLYTGDHVISLANLGWTYLKFQNIFEVLSNHPRRPLVNESAFSKDEDGGKVREDFWRGLKKGEDGGSLKTVGPGAEDFNYVEGGGGVEAVRDLGGGGHGCGGGVYVCIMYL